MSKTPNNQKHKLFGFATGLDIVIGYSMKSVPDPGAVSVCSATRYKNSSLTKMFGILSRLSLALALVAILFSLIDLSEANYKNAPMNGIMFGKRGPSDYESRGKTFTVLCEIATEACQAWFPSQEKK
ncbi:unnamed protein product, partial [Brenthis ino]